MSYVYVMVADGLTKIGVSKNPRGRREALRWTVQGHLRISGVRRFDCDAFQIERRTHKILAAYNVHGEWFNVTPKKALDAIRQAAIEHAKHMTRPDLPTCYYAARPDQQSYYRRLLGKLAS